jgi:hypothetical protein
MDYDYGQRRRVAFAIAITVIAVPAAFLLNRGGDDGATVDTGVTGQVAAAPLTGGDTGSVVTTPLGTAPAGYLEGSTVPDSNEPARIAIPQLPESVKLQATFSSRINSTQRCAVPGVPFNSTVTVTNLDNSRRIRCIASVALALGEDDLVLATDTFAEIADLTDAPVPVEITWVAPVTLPPLVPPPTSAAP